MSTQKHTDSPLLTSYTIAVLTQDHTDRMFVALDQYRNRLTWSRKYRPAVVYDTEQKAVDTMDEIVGGRFPHMSKDNVAVDLSTICVLQTKITFKVVRTASAGGPPPSPG